MDQVIVKGIQEFLGIEIPVVEETIVADIDEVLATTDINMDNLKLRFGLLDVKFQLKSLIE